MKKNLMLLVAMLLIFGSASVAGAISFYDPAAIGAPVFLNETSPIYSYTFDLDSDALYEGRFIFPYGTADIESGDIINSATLYIGTSDDAWCDSPESLSITLGQESLYEGQAHRMFDPFEFDVTAQLVEPLVLLLHLAHELVAAGADR